MSRRNSSLAVALPSLFDAPGETPDTPLLTHQVKVVAHRRTVRGPAGPTGRALRDAALDTLQADEDVVVARDYLRARLADLYRQRVVAWAHQPARQCVTADDLADLLDAWADCPASIRARTGQWRGSVFLPPQWEKTGASVPSLRRHMHHTQLACWKLREVSRG